MKIFYFEKVINPLFTLVINLSYLHPELNSRWLDGIKRPGIRHLFCPEFLKVSQLICEFAPADFSLLYTSLSVSILQWRPFLPGLKYDVIDSAYISLYTGKSSFLLEIFLC